MGEMNLRVVKGGQQERSPTSVSAEECTTVEWSMRHSGPGDEVKPSRGVVDTRVMDGEVSVSDRRE
jgi:hypothetical protein